jgi:hypothetical protein
MPHLRREHFVIHEQAAKDWLQLGDPDRRASGR